MNRQPQGEGQRSNNQKWLSIAEIIKQACHQWTQARTLEINQLSPQCSARLVIYALECKHVMTGQETRVMGVRSQQRLEWQINLQYSLLHPCNKAETWKRNIKGCSLWAGWINNISGEEKSFSFSLVPRGLSYLREVMSSGGLCHVPVTYTVSSPATSRWMLLSFGHKKEKLGHVSLLLGRDARAAVQQVTTVSCQVTGADNEAESKHCEKVGLFIPQLQWKCQVILPAIKWERLPPAQGPFVFKTWGISEQISMCLRVCVSCTCACVHARV